MINDVVNGYPFVYQYYFPIKFYLNTSIDRKDIDGAVRFMLINDFFLLRDYEEIQKEYGKAIFIDSYFGVIHSDVVEDFKNIEGFIDADNYECSKDKSEIGCIGNLRIFSIVDEKLKDNECESYYKMLCFEPRLDCRMISITFKKLGV